ncbi:MAG: hypothetical protein IPL13_18460 [Saprospiraceae bacterium]|nr:hypothetical protein [Candidatus Brachybacter algidus]
MDRIIYFINMMTSHIARKIKYRKYSAIRLAFRSERARFYFFDLTMVKNSCKAIFAIIVVMQFVGCVTFKPDSDSITSPDYNERKTITGAYYKGKLTPIGYGAVAASTLAGAFAGTQIDMVSYYQGESKHQVKAADIAIGSLVGFTASMLINAALGNKKIKPCTDPKEWLSKANKGIFILGKFGKYDRCHASICRVEIHVGNIKDIIDFKLAFPQSNYSDVVVQQSIKSSGISRADYPTIIDLYPSSKYTVDVKKQYIIKSNDLNAMVSAEKIYPNTGLDIEPHAALIVANCKDARLYQSIFKSGKFNKFVMLKGLNNCSENEVRDLPNVFPKDYKINQEDMVSLKADDNSRSNYQQAIFIWLNVDKIATLDAMFKKYNWLQFENKPKFVAQKYWEVANEHYKYGEDVLRTLRGLATLPEYKYLGVKDVIVNQCITDGLQKELLANVKLFETNIIASYSKEYEAWSKNNTYSAGLVSSTGDLKYLVYGKVQNNSKYNLPRKINVTSDLMRVRKVEGTGFWTNIAIGLSGQGGSSSTKVGSNSNFFQIPSLPPNSNAVYAVMLDFGQGQIASGSNLMDLFKFKEETQLGNTVITKAYDNSPITNSTIQRQLSWQNIAKSGMPDVPLVDLYRKTEINNDSWVQKYDDIQREAKEAAKRKEENTIYLKWEK